VNFTLTNHGRLDPNTPLHFGESQPLIQAATGCGQVVKWAGFNCDLVQFKRKGLQEFLAETGADSTSKLELSVFIDADQ
jgi:hypothetical protein